MMLWKLDIYIQYNEVVPLPHTIYKNFGEDVEKLSWYDYKMVQLLWYIVWQFLKRLKIELPYDSAILGIYPREMKTYLCIKSCTWIFIAVLFIIAKWKKIQVSINRGMNKQDVKYLYHRILAISRNEILIHATIWMNLENIVVSEKNHSQKSTYFMILFLWNVLSMHIYGDRKYSSCFLGFVGMGVWGYDG